MENFGKGSKVIFRWFYDFFLIFGKSSEILGKFPDVIGNIRNGSQELNNFGTGFREVLKWTPVNCWAQVMTGKQSGILPVAYYPLYTAEYATVILASDWLYFSRYGIQYNTTLISILPKRAFHNLFIIYDIIFKNLRTKTNRH